MRLPCQSLLLYQPTSNPLSLDRSVTGVATSKTPTPPYDLVAFSSLQQLYQLGFVKLNCGAQLICQLPSHNDVFAIGGQSEPAQFRRSRRSAALALDTLICAPRAHRPSFFPIRQGWYKVAGFADFLRFFSQPLEKKVGWLSP